MSEITFCTYVVTYSDDGPLPAAAKSVPVPPLPGSPAEKRKSTDYVESPFSGYLLGWYASSILQQISRARRAAAAMNRTLYRVNIVVEGGDYAPSRQQKANLKNIGVLHLDLLPSETRQMVYEQMGIPASQEISEYLWLHPNRLSDIWKIRSLRHLNAVMFSRLYQDTRIVYGAVHPKRTKRVEVLHYPHSVKLALDV